jgi:hypothetical protein
VLLKKARTIKIMTTNDLMEAEDEDIEFVNLF